MKLVIIGDTHGQHEELGTLHGDVLIHCGDFEYGFNDDQATLDAVDHWFSQQNFAHILAIGGNHDWAILQRLAEGRPVFQHAHYLQDQAFEYRGFNFYGTPWIPDLHGWPFFLDDSARAEKWAQIPDNTDILITHTPPFQILDQPRGFNLGVGCKSLRPRVAALRPILHCFGHVHAGYGQKELDGTLFINASITAGMKINPPVTVELTQP